MKKIVFNSVLAALMLSGFSAGAKPVQAKLTVGSKTSEGTIVGRNKDLITFRQKNMTGDVSYPADAIKDVVFPIKVDEEAIGKMMQDRRHEELAVALETALEPFMEYSDLPSNISKYQGVLMDLYYKVGNFDKSLLYSSSLCKDPRNPVLQRKAITFQGLALLGAGRMDEAQALFDAQGWTVDLGDDAPAEDLYITAKFLAMKKDYQKAIETVAKIVAFNSQDPDWMRPAELLCAQIYLELAQVQKNPVFLDSADEVIREITLLYKDTDEADQATSLKLRVDAQRTSMDAERDDEETDLFGR